LPGALQGKAGMVWLFDGSVENGHETVPHNLRNPLTSIKGYSELLLQSKGLDDMQLDFVQRIKHASQNMAELVENMLDLAKMDLKEESKFAALDVASMLAQIVHEFKPQEQSLSLQMADARFEVRGDTLKLSQAFRNLVGNAIKYTPAHGSISLSAGIEGHTAHICIKDTGYGIPTADLPNLFKRFYRVRNNGHDEIEGNGLGLAIVNATVEKHGGQVEVESEKGKGTCFTVVLPLAQPIALPETQAEPS
jgi:two-component system phosphate regulon sensor histidine kinase PhoR